MAEVILFHYTPGRSPLHRWDVRYKLLALLLLSTASLIGGWPSLAVFTVLSLSCLLICRIPLSVVFRNMRALVFLIALIVLARSLSEDSFFAFSVRGFLAGLYFSWRLVTVVLWAAAFTATTSVREFRAAVLWFLKPLPVVPAARVATMTGLVMGFFPSILDYSREVSLAQKARLVQRRKNPVRRIVYYVLPLFRRTFESADELVLAMEARCYSEESFAVKIKAGPADWIPFAAVLVLAAVLVVLF